MDKNRNKIRRIGIMGGTFNPIHIGHLQIAQMAMEQFFLETVFFIPAKCPYHKKITDLIPDDDRIEMVKLAIAEHNNFQLNLLEFDRIGNTYTIDTLVQLENQYPGVQFYFIIGADSLFDFLNWKDPHEIVKKAIILVATRGETLKDELLKQIHNIQSVIGFGIFYILEGSALSISSHEIRNQIKKGISIQKYVPKQVENYIRQYHLYEK